MTRRSGIGDPSHREASDPQSPFEALHRLADRWGIETSYRDALGRDRAASPEVLVAALRAMGAPITDPNEAPEALRAMESEAATPFLPPVLVAWDGRLPAGSTRFSVGATRLWAPITIELEDGENREVQARQDGATIALELHQPLPFGVHRLRLDLGGGGEAVVHVFSAPSRCWGEDPTADGDGRRLGLFAPVYALRSEPSATATPGDLVDLARLRDWALPLGVDTIGVLPLFAAFLDQPFDPSPYAPASRLFWNEIHLDPALSPDLASSPRAAALMAALDPSTKRLRDAGVSRQRPDRTTAAIGTSAGPASLVDWRGAMRVKREVLEALAEAAFASESRRAEIEAFARRDPNLDDYARFRAVTERQGAGWPVWPERQREAGPVPHRLVPADYDEMSRRYHLYAQWLWDHQFRALFGAGESLYLDLPIGVHADGFDVWRFRDQFALAASVGAPPDGFFAAGQDWGFPPPHPINGRATGHAYFRRVIQTQLQRAGMLRLDHVMALHRLFWIPCGFSARDGVYLRYPAEELYAIVTLESHRHRARIVGENLGTVPPAVNETIHNRGLLPMRIMQLEAGPHWPRDVGELEGLAALNTHDTATFASWWEGGDLELRQRLGLLDAEGVAAERERRAQIRSAVVAALRSEGWLDDASTTATDATTASEPGSAEAPSAAVARAPNTATASIASAAPKLSPEPSTASILRALLRRLAASGADVVIVQLEDLWLESEPQNVPGVAGESPWRRRMRRPLESIAADSALAAFLRELAALRRKARP